MIVIRRDKDKKDGKESKGKNNARRSFLPILGIIVIFLLLFLLIPIVLVFLFRLPWHITFIYPLGIIFGAILIIFRHGIIYMAIKGLRLKYSSSSYEKGDTLVTTGIYAYTRNPMYFGATIMIFWVVPGFPIHFYFNQ